MEHSVSLPLMQLDSSAKVLTEAAEAALATKRAAKKLLNVAKIIFDLLVFII